ncbi:hypothetical protein, partial [Anaerospora hongkongensis]|uniref:hypothetical protein n=1 Tax=Anaerospora hongkongensis TaxID=244830 RepID=UPI002FDB1867
MKSIGMEYKYYINQNGKDERQFFSVLEQDIIRSLSSSGYDRDQIKTALLKYSPVLRNQQSDFVENYFLRQMPQNFASENKPKLPAEFAYNQEKKRHADKIVQFYLPEDRRAAIYLLDIGRKIEDIQEVLLCKSALARELPDSKMTYCDLVMEGLNQERIKRHNRLLPLAEALYLQKATAISNKYIGYQQQNLNEYQEGSIVLSMMLQSGISTDMIAEVLRKHSRNEAMKHDPDYFPRILTKCEAAKDAYLAIARADNLQPVTPPNRYRLTAKEYMSQTRSVLLNGKDEQQIILKMHTLGFNPYEIKGAILQASPVAREPGRNPEQYAEASLTVLQEEKREHALHSTKEYNLTVNLYDEKRLQLLDQQRQQRNRTYFDGKIIRELLEMKRHIIKTVMEKNREQGRKTDAYVKGLIAAVQKAMRSEKAILECQKTIPEGRYTDLVRLGYTAKDMYRNAIKERVHVYPSTALDLTADFIDKDACEKLLT